MSNQIRVRIAPSPTGPLHIGTARTALFNWLFAKKNKGKFILRIEDTDLERSDPKFEEDIKESLKRLGLEWGEFYKQSERLETYKKHLQRFLDEGRAFWCRHTVEELRKESEEQMKRKEAPRHICQHKYEKQESRVASQGIIRLKVDENSTRVIHFNDIIRGAIEWEQRLIGDLSLAKNLDTPLYNFAVVVDDYETGISHVIRGEDHISNTPKQILIQEALGIKPPQYAHLPLILGSDKTKLSKRHGAESVNEYKKDYLPEAVVNFMGFLGYTYAKEILTKEEMAEEFDLQKVHKSAAVFNIEKLNWMNAQYIRRLSAADFKTAVGLPELPEAAVPLVTERLERLSDIKNFDYFWKEPEYEKELLRWPSSAKASEGKKSMTDEEVKKSLTLTKEVLGPVDWKIFDKDYIRKRLDDLARENFSGDRGAVYWPLRVVLTGKQGSPDPIELLAILGKEIVLKRIEKAINEY